MSGFMRNDWSRYLNGGTAQYNFLYRSELPVSPATASLTASLTASPAIVTNLHNSTKNNKNNKVLIPVQKGGKRKSKHIAKKYRLTHRKHSTYSKHRTHRKHSTHHK